MGEGKTAILIVNGGPDPTEGRWIQLCLDRIAEFTGDHDHHLFVWNNNTDDEAVAEIVGSRPNATLRAPETGMELTHVHGDPLQRMYGEARAQGFEVIVTMDSDAFPLEEGWLPELLAALSGGAVVAGVWTDEQPEAPPFVHPSTMATTAEWIDRNELRFDEFPLIRKGVRDTVIHFTRSALADGERLYGLPRSNGNSYHRIMGAVYGDRVYHHHAGSRPLVRFRYETHKGQSRDEVLEANARLRDQASRLVFRHHGHTIRWLRGRSVIDTPGEPARDFRLAAFDRADAEAVATLLARASNEPDAARQTVPEGVDFAPPRTRRREVAVVADPDEADVVCFRRPDQLVDGWVDWYRDRLARAKTVPTAFAEAGAPSGRLLVSLGLRPDRRPSRHADRPVPEPCREVCEALRAAARGDDEDEAFTKGLVHLLDLRAECDRLKRKQPIRRILRRVPIVRGVMYRSGALWRRLRNQSSS